MKSPRLWIVGMAALAACSYDASQLQGSGAGGGDSSVGDTDDPLAGSGGTGGAGGEIANDGPPGSGGDTVGDAGTSVLPCGPGVEPCSQPIDVWGNSTTTSGASCSVNFGTTGTVCYRTADDIAGWSCSNFSGWSLKVNGQATACDQTAAVSTLPPKVGSFYYFEATSSADAVSWAGLYWWGTGHPGPYPSCGSSAAK
jgi:hypothetical protein